MWEESLGTQAGVHLIEGVRLIRGPLNTGFTVQESRCTFDGIASSLPIMLRAYVALCWLLLSFSMAWCKIVMQRAARRILTS